MSGDGWGSSFIDPTRIKSFNSSDPFPIEGDKLQPKTLWELHKEANALLDEACPIVSYDPNTDLISAEIVSSDAESVVIREVYKARKLTNTVPTHDPYTNPNAELYYSCNCGAILDTGTKRFAELNNHASNAGWKIRFTDTGYVPYCVECGKGVE